MEKTNLVKIYNKNGLFKEIEVPDLYYIKIDRKWAYVKTCEVPGCYLSLVVSKNNLVCPVHDMQADEVK
jgi:hypothetical protein